MTNLELARWYAALLGVGLVILGLAGFVENPIVGEPAANPLFVTDAAHNLVHIASGAIALFIAFGLSGTGLANGLLAFGAAYLVLLLASLASPDLFGLFGGDVNLADHVLHAGLGTLSIAVAWLARPRAARQVAAG
jgi:hypothetical protein